MMYSDVAQNNTSQVNVFGYLCVNRRDEILRYLLSGVTNNRNELTSIHVTRLFHLLGFQDGALWSNSVVTKSADRMCTWGSTLLPGALIDSLRQTSWVSLLTLPLHPLVL